MNDLNTGLFGASIQNTKHGQFHISDKIEIYDRKY